MKGNNRKIPCEQIPQKTVSQLVSFSCPARTTRTGFRVLLTSVKVVTPHQHLPDPVCPVGTHGDQGNIIFLCNRQDHLGRISHPYMKIHGNTGIEEILFYVCKPGLCIPDSCFNLLVRFGPVDNMQEDDRFDCRNSFDKR